MRIGAEAARLGLRVAVEAGVAGHVVDWGGWRRLSGRRTHVTPAKHAKFKPPPPLWPDEQTWRLAAVSGA